MEDQFQLAPADSSFLSSHLSKEMKVIIAGKVQVHQRNPRKHKAYQLSGTGLVLLIHNTSSDQYHLMAVDFSQEKHLMMIEITSDVLYEKKEKPDNCYTIKQEEVDGCYCLFFDDGPKAENFYKTILERINFLNKRMEEIMEGYEDYRAKEMIPSPPIRAGSNPDPRKMVDVNNTTRNTNDCDALQDNELPDPDDEQNGNAIFKKAPKFGVVRRNF